MKVSLRRRQLLVGSLGLPLAACQPEALPPSPPEFGPPAPAERGLVVLLVAGLNVSDVLVAANVGALPHLERVLQRGMLVESIRAESGLVYTPEEMRREMTGSWGPTAVLSSDAEGGCVASEAKDLEAEDPVALAHTLRCLFAMAAERSEGSGARGVLVETDHLLAMQRSGLLLDERQPGYSAERALASTERWRQALYVLDLALGDLLEQVDLRSRSVVLASSCEAWPVFAGLGLDAMEARSKRVLAGGAIVETSADASWPDEGAWAEVVVGRPPEGEGAVRLLAPAGHVFLATGEELPRARAHPTGFLVGAGGGLPQGVRLPLLRPRAVGALLAHLRVGTVAGLAPGSSRGLDWRWLG